MKDNIFKNKLKEDSVYKHFTLPRRDYLYNARKRLIKNYVIDPEIKLIG